MTDTRTDFQREADELLDAAIVACAKAYGQVAIDALLVDFALVSVFDSLDLDERGASAYSYLTKGRGAPIHTTLGLLAMGTRYYSQDWSTDDD
jgi:hypothetical protein